MREGKKTRLSIDDIEYIKKSDMKDHVLAEMFKCSLSAIRYHRRTGIFIKQRKR